MDDALRRHPSRGAALATNFSELWGTLANYVGSLDVVEVTCVLDALDECDEEHREMRLEQIRGFYQNKRVSIQAGKLKFLITSRPHDGIEVALSTRGRTTDRRVSPDLVLFLAVQKAMM